MVEIEKMYKSNSASERMKYIKGIVNRLLVEDIDPVIRAIDSGKFDDVVWANGKWSTMTD
jgi:hypothetical protein